MKNGNGPKLGEFSTSDLYFAAYLVVAGAPLIRTDRLEAKVQFIFSVDVVNIEELKNAWFNNTGKVAANPYAYQIKALKSMVHMK